MNRTYSFLLIVVMLFGCKEQEDLPKEKTTENTETEITFEKTLSNQNSKDACVVHWYPSQNGGYDDTSNQGLNSSLWIMNWLPYDDPGLPAKSRLFIQFDLTEIPRASEISSATLYLYPNKALDGSEGWKNNGNHFYDSLPNSFSYYQVLDSWDEHTITWVNTPSVNDVASGQFGPILGQKIIELNCKELAQFWVDNPSLNHGIFLKLDEERSNKRIVVGSTESTYKPKIVVKYQ